MQKVIGVRLKKAGKVHLFDPGDDDIQRGDSVIVETVRGLECCEVVIGVREIPISESPDCPNIQTPRRIYRKATQADLARVAENRTKEKRAFDICAEKIAEHGLPMNLISVTYTFDMNKIVFEFTAENRVDFRALVRDLAYIFHTRIELRQVGIREEARILGGIGCCGRALCCSTFLGDFAQVSIRMAKEQNLSLNPTKISGICGRLLCCLKYENDYYHQNYLERVQNFQPTPNERVVFKDKISGRVISINEARRNATILSDDGKTIVASWGDLIPFEGDDPPEISNIVDEPAEADIEEASTERPFFNKNKTGKNPNRPSKNPKQKNFKK